jgi:hypothetical protein
MNQSRIDSLMESVVNIIIGLIVSTIANWAILPAVLGVSMSLGQNLLIGSAFTVISLVRSYVIRRAFNGRSVWGALKARLRRGESHNPDIHRRASQYASFLYVNEIDNWR